MDATKMKPFNIDKRLVYDGYKAVKAIAGAAGVDKQTLEEFDKDLMRNLYKIWNRMSSGCYFPPPVRAVAIPKKTGGQRILGVPTVADRVAQMVVKQVLERTLEPLFMADSYGYRPNKSALDAIETTSRRCRQHDWVLEFDIRHEEGCRRRREPAFRRRLRVNLHLLRVSRAGRTAVRCFGNRTFGDDMCPAVQRGRPSAGDDAVVLAAVKDASRRLRRRPSGVLDRRCARRRM